MKNCKVDDSIVMSSEDSDAGLIEGVNYKRVGAWYEVIVIYIYAVLSTIPFIKVKDEEITAWLNSKVVIKSIIKER